jgi:hypothetical protein
VILGTFEDQPVVFGFAFTKTRNNQNPEVLIDIPLGLFMESDMAEGPGKYDEEATMVRLSSEARFVLVWIYGGNRGEGFSVQGDDPTALKAMPKILREIANQIEKDVANIT